MSYKTTDKTSTDLLSLLANRRSYYTLSSTSPIPASKIQHILQQTLHTVPSAFNSQTTRLVLALGPHHKKIWDTTADLLRSHMGEERWSSAPTAKKLAGFRAAYGTVLFYEDMDVVEEKKAAFSSYSEHFGPWSEQTSGMHQLAVWVALEAEGLGANLQHYNPVVDDKLAEIFGVPGHWRLRSQLVFGGVEQDRPAAKEKRDFKETLKVFGGEE